MTWLLKLHPTYPTTQIHTFYIWWTVAILMELVAWQAHITQTWYSCQVCPGLYFMCAEQQGSGEICKWFMSDCRLENVHDKDGRKGEISSMTDHANNAMPPPPVFLTACQICAGHITHSLQNEQPTRYNQKMTCHNKSTLFYIFIS